MKVIDLIQFIFDHGVHVEAQIVCEHPAMSFSVSQLEYHVIGNTPVLSIRHISRIKENETP